MKFVLVFLVSMFALVMTNQAQLGALGNIKDGHSASFTSDQYYEPPNGQHIKIRMTGSSSQSLPDAVLDIRDLKIEKFSLDGKTEAIIRAPQCNYSIFKQTASSDGHLEFESGDGRLMTTGDGFLWRQSDNSLTISNNVYTKIKIKAGKLTVP